MPKVAVSATDRLKEYKNEGFIISCGILMCKYCDCRLDYRRKDALDKHCKSEKHSKRRENSRLEVSVPRVATLKETLSNASRVKDMKEEFILDTTTAFVKANIPVEKLDNPAIRTWFNKYVRGSGDLPSANQIRQKYIPMIGERRREEIREDIKNKDVFLLCDETTDKNGRCVFNILFRPSVPSTEMNTHLAASVVLDSANSVNCSNAILDTLNSYEIERERVVAVVTDSARYMTKCVTTLQGLIEELSHVQCWAHKVNLIGCVFENELDELNMSIVKTKNAFLNTRKRKSNYVAFLREKYENTEKENEILAFPMPVCTRWNSWFKAAMYMATHVEDLVEFFKTLEDSNSGVKFFQQASTSTIQFIQLQALYVSVVGASLMDLLNFLEGSKYPTIHLLAGKLDDLEVKLKLLGDGGMFNHTILQNLEQLPQKMQIKVKSKLTCVAQSALVKVRTLRTTDPARKTVEAIGSLFDPRHAPKNVSPTELLQFKKNAPFLTKMESQQFLEAHSIYLTAIKNQLRHEDNVNVPEILMGLRPAHRDYATAALKCVWYPCSNVDSERSFSKYSLIVSDRRRKLTAANAETLTMIYFQ